jgi:peptidoglycan/LPS O-acetylase OafA/YrhL
MSQLRPAASTSANRIAELDALRGLAALGVVFYHYLTRFQEMYGRHHPALWDFNAGGYGVWLFFMLSGYVIFMTLDRTRNLLDFAVSRTSRLYPAFWAAVAITYLVTKTWGLPGQDLSLREAVVNLTMLPRIFHADFVDGVYWSLEPELFFYACMAGLFVVGALKRLRLTLALWLVLAIACHLVLAHLDSSSPLYRFTGKFKDITSLEFIHLFAIGMIFYDVRRTGSVWTRGHLALITSSLSLVFWFSKWPESLVTAAMAGVLYLATTGRLPFLNWRPLLWLGFISYPLYLVHQNMGYILLRKLDVAGWNPYLASGLVALGAMAVAAVLSYGVEYPVMRRIRSAMKARRQATPPNPNAQPAIPDATF